MEIGKTILLDSRGDIVIDELGRVPVITGPDKARQDLMVIIRSAQGSLSSDPMFGNKVMDLARSRGNQAIVEGAMRLAIQQYAYTQSVDSITVGALGKSRKMAVSASVTLTNTVGVSLEVAM